MKSVMPVRPLRRAFSRSIFNVARRIGVSPFFGLSARRRSIVAAQEFLPMSFRSAHACGLSVAFAALCAAPAFAENLQIPEQILVSGKNKIVIRNLEAIDTNATAASVLKMFSPETTEAERVGLLKGFKAAKLVIPRIEVTNDKTTIVIRDVRADGVDGGKVAKATIAGAEASDDKGFQLKARGLTVDDSDLSSFTNVLLTSDVKTASPRVGAFRFDGLDAVVVEDGPKDKTGKINLSLGGVEAKNAYAGDLYTSGVFTVKNLVISPEKASKMGRDLASFGYDKLDLGLTSTLAYDPASKALNLSDLTISGVGAGALSLKAQLGGVEKGFASPDRNQQIAAFIGADISSIQLKHVDAGLFQKALAFAAGKRDPNAVREEWKAAAGQYIPLVLGGDQQATAFAAEVQKFIADPRSLTLTATGKVGPVKIMELPTLKDPASALRKINLTASAN
jgi:hypothetical protein